MLKRGSIQCFESLIFLLSFLLVLKYLLFVGCDVGKYLPLSLQKLLLLIIELLRLRNNVLFLLGELLVNSSLFAFFLEQSDGLKWTLALYDKGPDSGQILVTDLRVRVLAHILVDPIEQIIDLTLLVNVHFAVNRFVCNFFKIIF